MAVGGGAAQSSETSVSNAAALTLSVAYPSCLCEMFFSADASVYCGKFIKCAVTASVTLVTAMQLTAFRATSPRLPTPFS